MIFLRPLLAAGFLAASLASAQEATGPWTLERALAHARAAHPNARLALARMDEALAARDEALAAQWPQLSLDGRYMQTTHPMQAFGAILSQGTFDFGLDFNDPGQIDALSVGAEVRYPVYTGGRRAAQEASAEARLRAREEDHVTATTRLADAVVEGYFTIRQADAVMNSLAAGIEVLEESLRVSRAREASGDLIRTERLNLEVELARLERQRLAAAHRQQLARYRFAFLLGLAARTPVQLAADDPALAGVPAPSDPTVAGRSELQAARAELEAARRQVTAARSGWRPQVNAFARVDWDKGFRREGDGSSWTAGVAVDVPVFDGHATRARVSQAHARVRMAEETLRHLEMELALELEQARLAHELAEAQLEVARQQLRSAAESAELSRERFAAGSLLSTELIGVESRLVDARVQEALSTYQERAALAHYRRMAGLPIIP